MQKVAVFWFRRDLRLNDNVGLYQALSSGLPVLPIFIFDEEILNRLPEDDARVSFVHEQLQKLRFELERQHKSSIAIFHGSPETIFKQLLEKYPIQAVYTNHDYEPYAQKRDTAIQTLLESKKVDFKTFKDQVLFEKEEVVKDDGTPYVVYTPYKNKWKSLFNKSLHLVEYDTLSLLNNTLKEGEFPNLSIEAIGFKHSSIKVEPYNVSPGLIADYGNTRDYPSKRNGTSRLGPHLRFGTVSIRKMVEKAIAQQNDTFFNELIWREFFMQILWHFPHTTCKAFRPKYDWILWRNDENDFEKWKNGQTGFPLVDAGMRELNATGYMHNRVRMLVASFLCKHLLIDWRWGEIYFAEKLLDYELSSNVGNWQWAAGSGVDAAPYFRIFNPTTQVAKFDKEYEYIKKWIPEIEELTYPQPMIDHKLARERCLKVYKKAVS